MPDKVELKVKEVKRTDITIDVPLFEHIRVNANVWQPMDGVSIFITLLMEGGASALIITLAAMQYFKRNGGKENEITE